VNMLVAFDNLLPRGELCGSKRATPIKSRASKGGQLFYGVTRPAAIPRRVSRYNTRNRKHKNTPLRSRAARRLPRKAALTLQVWRRALRWLARPSSGLDDWSVTITAALSNSSSLNDSNVAINRKVMVDVYALARPGPADFEPVDPGARSDS